MNIEIRDGFRPGFIGRIAQMHGEYYAKVWGSGVAFESLMAKEICEFSDRYDPAKDLVVTAHDAGRLIGSIAVIGTQSERPGAARLRWFLMEEEYQGRGVGSTLLRHALAFCREQGFPLVYLWTVEGLPQSLGLYERAGFHIVERSSGSGYTVEHVHLRLELPLSDVPLLR